MTKHEAQRIQAGISYFLSLTFFALSWFTSGHWLVSIGFILIHLSIIAFGILLVLWFIFAAKLGLSVGRFMGKIQESDIKEFGLMMQTFPQRVGIGLLYWFIPIGTYLYFLTHTVFLYPFVWLPLWFPGLYFYLEKKIKEKEIEINSPIINQPNW